MAAIADDDIEQTLLKSRMVTAEQIQAAKEEQARLARRGEQLSLAETLVRQGVITDTIAGNMAQAAKDASTPFGFEAIGRFKLIRKLGEGGMGTVYLAEDTEAHFKVALKVLPEKFSGDTEFVSRFRREAKAATELQHPNIAAAYAEGEEKGMHYYAMEYFEGESLDKIQKREIHLPLDRVMDIVIQVAQGLKYAHANGIIHRDIKPGNIFITRAGIVKILDMGLSKDLRSDELSFNTASGSVLGTAHYISPEQARGDRSVDGRADIYSLGATFYNLVTGKTPFQGATPALVMMKHLTEQLPNPQDIFEHIPDSVVIVIQKMMAKDAADRYQECGVLIGDLELIRAGKTPPVAPLEEGKSSILHRRTAPTTADAPTLVRPVVPIKTGAHNHALTSADRVKLRALVYVAVLLAAVALIAFAWVKLTGGKETKTAEETKPVGTSAVTAPIVSVTQPAVTPDVKPPDKPVPPPKIEKPLLLSEDFESLDLANPPAGWKIAAREAFSIVPQPEHGKALRLDVNAAGAQSPQIEMPLDIAKIRGRVITATILARSPNGYKPLSAANIYAPKKPTFALYWIEPGDKTFRYLVHLEPQDREFTQLRFTRKIPPEATGASIHIEMPDTQGEAFFDELKVDFAAENAELSGTPGNQENRTETPRERQDDNGAADGIKKLFK